MAEYGKVDGDFLERVVYPRLGADREEVRLGPTHGVDFGVVDVGGRALVVATDPLSVLPQLGFERAARFALDIVLADVAVSGLAPRYLSMNFTLPPGMTDEEFEQVWTAIDAEASDLGLSVVTGHTARYEGCTYPWIGGATAFATGAFDAVIRPDGARPGDKVVVSTGPGAEAVGLLTTLFGDRMDLPAETIDTARDRLAETDTVRDALTAAAVSETSETSETDGTGGTDGMNGSNETGGTNGTNGVTAIHDATECGLQGALCEMAASSETRFEVERGKAPLRPGVETVCSHLGIDPWQVTSSGTLAITAPPDTCEAIVGALEDRGTAAAIVGRVVEGSGMALDGEDVSHPRVDPSWDVYAEYANGG